MIRFLFSIFLLLITNGISSFILFSDEFKENIVPFFGQAIVIVTNHMLVGLFIYFVVGDFKLFGFILSLIVFLEFFITLLFGRFVDKNHDKSLKNSASLHAFSNFNMSFFAKTAFFTAFLQLFNQITWSLLDNSFTTKIHKKMQNSRKDSFLYSSTKEMALCFLEVCIFFFYIFLLFFLSVKSFFSFVFLFTIFGIFLAVRFFKD